MRLSAPPPSEAEADAITKTFLEGLDKGASKSAGSAPVPTLSLSQLERVLDIQFRLLETLVVDVAGVDHMLSTSLSEARSATSSVSDEGSKAGSWAKPWVEQSLNTLSPKHADEEAIASLTMQSSVLQVHCDEILQNVLQIKVEFQMAFRSGEMKSTKAVKDIVQTASGWRGERKKHLEQALRISSRLDERAAELQAHAEALRSLGGHAPSHLQEAFKSVASHAPNIVHLCHIFRHSNRGGASANSSIAKGADDLRAGLRGAAATLALLGGVLGRVVDALDDLDGWKPVGVDPIAPRQLRSEVYVVQAQVNGALDALDPTIRPDVRVMSGARAALDRAWVLEGELICLLRELPDEDTATKRSVSARQRSRLIESARSYLRERTEGERNLDDFLRWFHSEYDDQWFEQNVQRLRNSFSGPFQEVLQDEKQHSTSQSIAEQQEQFKSAKQQSQRHDDTDEYIAADSTNVSNPIAPDKATADALTVPKMNALERNTENIEVDMEQAAVDNALADQAMAMKSMVEGDALADLAAAMKNMEGDGMIFQVSGRSEQSNAELTTERQSVHSDALGATKNVHDNAMVFQPPDRHEAILSTVTPPSEENLERAVTDSSQYSSAASQTSETQRAMVEQQMAVDEMLESQNRLEQIEPGEVSSSSQTRAWDAETEEQICHGKFEPVEISSSSQARTVDSETENEEVQVEAQICPGKIESVEVSSSSKAGDQAAETEHLQVLNHSTELTTKEPEKHPEKKEDEEEHVSPSSCAAEQPSASSQAQASSQQPGAASCDQPKSRETAKGSCVPEQQKKTWSRTSPLERAHSDSPDLLESQCCLFDDPDVLFLITRSKNDNTVVYRHLADDNSSPCEAFWWDLSTVPRPAHNRAELIWLEKKFAYGVSAKKVSNSEFSLTLVALKSRQAVLQRTSNGPRAMMEISGRNCALYRIYVHAVEAIPMPKVQFVNIHGVDLSTGVEVVEKIIP